MTAVRASRTLLIGLAVLGAILAVFFAQRKPADRTDTARPATPDRAPTTTTKRPAAAPRGLQGLTLDEKNDISADGRPPNVRRESIIRTGLGEIQEMQQMHKPIFDDAAKRWNALPRVKELIAQWKEVEEAWKTQDDEAKAAVVPRMEAMWKEALGLLREEVERSAHEAEAGVK